MQNREGFTRRKFLETSGQGALALGLGSVIASCVSDNGGGAAPSGGRVSAGGGTPVQGGEFNVGIIGGGSSEQLYPGAVSGFPDLFRIQQLYDNLFDLSVDEKLTLVPALALSAESNADATLWTFKLRDDVLWHDGKPFSANDVVYSFRKAWTSPANASSIYLSPFVDFKGVRKRDRLTVEVPLVQPCAQFPTLFTFLSVAPWIVPDGSTPEQLTRRPIGTGPFKFVSFSPGQRSEFEANRDYWDGGKPYVDRLVVDSTFSDDTALLNALLSGQINVLTPLPFSQARRYLNSTEIKVLRARGHTGSFVYMRVDDGPFQDVRVRQALKLAIDRQVLIRSVLDGFGQVGSDVNPLGSPRLKYGISPPAVHDPERARSLLKAAGREGMTATIETARVNDTFVSSATLVAQQAEAAGFKLQVKVRPTSTYYTAAGGYGTRFLGQETGGGAASLMAAYMQAAWSGAPFNITGWGNQEGGAATDRLLFDAIAATEPAKAESLWRRVQQDQVDKGGFINWANADTLDAVATNVRGLRESESFNLNNYRMLDGWIANG